MHFHKVFHQLYNELCAEPDFPAKKADELWSKMPHGSQNMAAALYLLPFGEKLSAKELNHGKILMLLTLSAFIHGDLERNFAFSDGESVLYGDYLFALAISLIPEDFRHEDAENILHLSYRFGENRLRQENERTSSERYLEYARADYGELLKNIAEESAKQSGMTEDHRQQYARFAEALGTAWGILCERYPIDHNPLLDEAATNANGLEQEQALLHIIEKMRGTANENHG